MDIISKKNNFFYCPFIGVTMFFSSPNTGFIHLICFYLIFKINRCKCCTLCKPSRYDVFFLLNFLCYSVNISALFIARNHPRRLLKPTNTASKPGGKSAGGVALTSHLHLAPRLRKNRVILLLHPFLPLWHFVG